jgi:hypothetical protein
MKLQRKILATAVILAASATSAHAEPFKLNVGNIDTSLAVTGLFADANTYAADGGGAGINAAPASVVNFNPNATSVYTQPVATTKTAGWLNNGDILNFSDNGSVPISSFNNVLTTLQGTTSSMEGFGTTWGMRLDYTVNGNATVTAIAAPINMATVANGQVFVPVGSGMVPTFTGGTFKFFVEYLQPAANFWNGFLATPFPNVANGAQVLELNVAGGTVAIGNLTLDGEVDYTNAGAWTPQQKNFFTFADGTTFYSQWLAGLAPTWAVNTNVEPNLVPRTGNAGGANFPAKGAPGFCPNDATHFCRSTLLNMDVGFEKATIPVPEPDMMLMMGAGIMGLGFATAKRRRKQLAA